MKTYLPKRSTSGRPASRDAQYINVAPNHDPMVPASTMPHRLNWNLSGVRPMRRRWNHDFAGQREQRTFHRHHQRDERITARLQRVIIPIAQGLDDLMHKAVVIAEKQAEWTEFSELNFPDPTSLGFPGPLIVILLNFFRRRWLRPDPILSVRILPIEN